MGRSLDVVNEFYEITNNRQGTGLGEILTTDMRFTGPLMVTQGADEYIAFVGQLLAAHAETTMLRQFEDGDQVCSIYDLSLMSPAGERVAMRIADWITVRGGQVAAQEILYDPREFARAFGFAQSNAA